MKLLGRRNSFCTIVIKCLKTQNSLLKHQGLVLLVLDCSSKVPVLPRAYCGE